MSSFYAFDFIYDNIPSTKFGLKIITFEDGGLFNGVGSSDTTILEQRVLRKSKPYYIGRTQETKLEFPLTFGTAYPISGMERDLISKWLFGRAEYKKLYIMQDDLNGAYFNCFMTAPQPLYIGGINYAFTCNVTCDSPWAYGIEHKTSASVVGWKKYGYDYEFTIYNASSEDEYLYPNIYIDYIHMTPLYGQNGVFHLTNFSENPARAFIFSDMNEGYHITVSNDLQTITAKDNYGYNISGMLPRFNKKWFRLLPGVNSLGVIHRNIGDEAYFEISWTERMKIGG